MREWVWCTTKSWNQEPCCWHTIKNGDRWNGYHLIKRWLITDAGIMRRTRTIEDQGWEWRKLWLIFHLSIGWWHCRNGKLGTTGGSCHYPCYNEAYGDGRNSNVESVSASKGFKSWLPKQWTDRHISHQAILARPWWCFGTTRFSGRSTCRRKSQWHYVPAYCLSYSVRSWPDIQDNFVWRQIR